MKEDSAEWELRRSGQVLDHQFQVFPLSQSDVAGDTHWISRAENIGVLRSLFVCRRLAECETDDVSFLALCYDLFLRQIEGSVHL